MSRLFFALALSLIASLSSAETVKIAVTTSFENSGLADVLVPEIEADLQMDIQLLVVGTGQALRLGRAGDVDAILVHSRAAEEDFVAQGYGPHRREIMYNDFVLIGPQTDPAQIASATTVKEAMQKINHNKAIFVSRGDDSGTHKAESKIWRAAGLDPKTFGAWYRAVGAGMGAALNSAAAMEAYILSDRASWLNFKNKSTLALLYSGDPALFNQYAFLPVQKTAQNDAKMEATKAIEDWLVSEKAQALINGYRVNDQQLFVFNAIR